MPLLVPGISRCGLGLSGRERFDIPDVAAALLPGAMVQVRLHRPDGDNDTISLRSRVDTRREVEWVRRDDVLPYVMHELAAARVSSPPVFANGSLHAAVRQLRLDGVVVGVAGA